MACRKRRSGTPSASITTRCSSARRRCSTGAATSAAALFDASVGGGGDARRLLAQLTDEADRLYKPRASAPPLNEALKAARRSAEGDEGARRAFPRRSSARRKRSRRRASGVTSSRCGAPSSRRVAPRSSARVTAYRSSEGARRSRLRLAAFGEVTRHAARITSLHARLDSYEGASKAHRDDSAASEVLRDRVAEAARRAGVAAGSKELRIDVRTQNQHPEARQRAHDVGQAARDESRGNCTHRARARAASCRAPGTGEPTLSSSRRSIAPSAPPVSSAISRRVTPPR